MLFYGYVDQEEVEGDKELVWNAFWVDTWDTESEVEAQEWYRVEQIRQTAGAWLFYVYHKVTDTKCHRWSGPKTDGIVIITFW